MKSAFAKETDLCRAFTEALPSQWTAYNECCSWDILLVRRSDGCQIGIQAKLRLNAEVLCQAAEKRSYYFDQGPCPDFRAVLVPEGQTGKLADLAAFCGLTVITMRQPESRRYRLFEPDLPSDDPRDSNDDNGCWHEMMPAQRHVLPEYVPDVPAGASGPTQLTVWKVKALKLAVLLDATGYLTRDDFKRLRVDIRAWIGHWLEPHPDIQGYRDRGGIVSSFRGQHPRVWEQIKAEPEKWERPAALLPLRPQPSAQADMVAQHEGDQ